MKKALPIGVGNYRELKEQDYYTVDKSLIIEDFLMRKSKVTLITRPRRFGKTINMSMMTEFFDITKESKELFKDTKIMKTDYASEMNQYPTIFISFANAKGEKSNMIRLIKQTFQEIYQKNDKIFKELDEYDTSVFNTIKASL